MDQLHCLVAGSREIAGDKLKERVLRAAAGLAKLGIVEGDRVALLMRNDLPLVEASLATQHLGAYPVQLNWHSKGDEVRHVLQDSAPSVLIAHVDLFASIKDAVPEGLTCILVIPPGEHAAAYRVPPERCVVSSGMVEWESWISELPSIHSPAKQAPESIIYTSGTTGFPKGVRRFGPSDHQINMTERMRQTVFGIDANSRVLVTAPLYHTAPNLFAFRAVRKGEILVLPTRFSPEALLADIERHRITHLYAVPTIFVRLLNLPTEIRAKYKLSSLSFVLHAGGPCPPSVKRQMMEWFGPIIHEYYGSTEAGPSTFVRGEEWLRKPGTVGRPVDGVTIEVRDDAGNLLGDHEVGELWVRNDGYADFTYLNCPDARKELQRGNMITTGDLGYRDSDGYYFLCDRKRDLVISGGVNIYPAEIEAVLQTMPGIADSAVFGIPHAEFGETLAAIVEPLPGHDITPSHVQDFLIRNLSNFKVPRVVEITAHLPREESGKIKKRLLREPYWVAAGRSI